MLQTISAINLIFTKNIDHIVHIGCSQTIPCPWQFPHNFPSCGSNSEDLCGFCIFCACEATCDKKYLKYE